MIASRAFLATAVLCAAALSLSAPAASAQVVLHSDAYAFSGPYAAPNVVRDAEGTLYCASIRENDVSQRELIVHSSDDDGASWEWEPVVFNDAASGLTPPEPTNGCALAIDDRGVLHITWGNYYYPSSYRQFYRNYDPASGDTSEIFDVSAWTGAARTARTAAMGITVDDDSIVWLVAHGPRSWVEQLAHSARPYAEGLEFVDDGAISPSASAQSSRIALDTAGRVHCTFYRNIGAGQYEHRIYDPASGWSDSVNLGNVAPPNDLWGCLATDALGNAHVLLVEDGTSDSAMWRFAYRRWNEADGWGEATTLMNVAFEDHSGIANYKIFALACDETTGRVTALYRNLPRGGALGWAEKDLDDDEFGEFHELAPPTIGQHEYYAPTLRGSLYPEFNRASAGRHATWQHRPQQGVPPYALVFAALDESTPTPRFRRGEADDNGALNLTDAVFGLSALFIPGSPMPTCLDAADSNDDGEFNLSDGVYSLNALFAGGPPPPAPGSLECGVDPTVDDLDCARYDSC